MKRARGAVRGVVRLIALGLAVVGQLASAASANADSVLDTQCAKESGISAPAIHDGLALAQTFVILRSGVLSKVGLVLERPQGTTIGTFTLRIVRGSYLPVVDEAVLFSATYPVTVTSTPA